MIFVNINKASIGSLPVWEEWIEILMDRAKKPKSGRLFPYGKSGLKSDNVEFNGVKFMSLPVWEEWIEMLNFIQFWELKSLPVWEEWIEILIQIMLQAAAAGLFPYGKSGLKCGICPYHQ